MKVVKWLALGVIVAAVAYVGGAGLTGPGAAFEKIATYLGSSPADTAKPKPNRPSVPAVVATVAQKEMPVEFRSVGSVQVESSVQIKVRVESVVEQVLAADGALVKPGDVLVELDKRQIEAQIEQAKAAIKRDEAQMEQALRNDTRSSDLMQRGITSRVTADDAKTAASVAEANKIADTALLKALQLQRSFHTITAPIGGRLGVVNARPGTFLRNADANSIIGTINQIDPIYVAIAIPQQLLGQVATSREKGTALVELQVPGTETKISGPITMIDNTVDPTTGLLTVRAKVPNPQALIWPGQVTDARLILRMEPGAIVVPNDAVQVSQTGNYVFVVDDQNIARVRSIRIARTVGAEAVVASGVKPGERVVTDGQFKLTDGTPVTIATKPRTEARAATDSASHGE